MIEDVLSDVDLSSVNFDDVDAGANLLTVTLTTATGGQLSASSGGGVIVGGSATAMTFTGSLTDLNTYFDVASNIRYVHGTTHTNGDNADSITVVLNDNGNTGSGGGTDQNLGTVNVDITSVNDAPSGADNTLTIAEDTDLVLIPTDFGFTDIDSNLFTSVDISPSTNGTLFVDTNDNGTIELGEAITATRTVTVSDIAAGRLIFRPAAGESGVGYATFDFQVRDDGGTANGGQDLDPTQRTMTIDVTSVNDAPVLDNSGTPTVTGITEDDINNAGMTVSDLLLSGAGSDPISDEDTGAAEGIAITSLTESNGQWEFSIDGGSNWSAVGTVSDSSALLLRSIDLVRFNPNGDNGTAETFDFRAWDQTSGTEGVKVDTTTNGGSTAFSTAIETASISVSDVNDAPILDNSGTVSLDSQLEDAGHPVGAVGTVITSIADLGLNVTDVDTATQVGIAVTAADTTNGVWWYTTDGGTNWNALGAVSDSSARVLNSNSNTRIYFESNPDFNGTVNNAITFRAWDRTVGPNGSLQDASITGGTTAFSLATETADITITSVNDAPFGSDFMILATEDVAYQFSQLEFGFGDFDGDSLQAIRISDLPNDGVLFNDANADGIVDIGEAITTTTDISAADIVAGQFKYLASPNSTGPWHESFQFQVIDDGGTANGGTDIDATPNTVLIDVSNVNDAPVLLGEDVLINGDLTANLSNWTATGNVDHDGSSARFGQIGGANGTLSQTFSTNVGETYILSFFYGDRSNAEDQSLNIDVTGSTSLLNQDVGSGIFEDTGRFFQYTFTADSASTTLTFTDTSASHAGAQGYLSYVSVNRPFDSLPTNIYVEGDGTIFLENQISLVDVDMDDMVSATIAITGGYQNGADVLSFVDQLGVSGSWNASTAELTLTGSSSILTYEYLVNQVQYTNVSEDPSNATRTISYSVNDGTTDSVIATNDLQIVPVNDPPTISNIAGDTLNYFEGDGAQRIDQSGNASVFDVDSADFDSGVLTVSFIAGSDAAEDILSIANQGTGLGQIGISGSNVSYGGVVIGTFTGGSGGTDLTITLNANANSLATTSLLRAINFENINTDDPTTGNRTVRFILTDGDGGMSGNHDATVSVSGVNDIPILDLDADDSGGTPGLDYSTSFTAGDPAVSLVDGAIVADVDNTIQLLTVQITNIQDGADEVLSFVANPNIGSSYTPATGVLQLTNLGAATNTMFENLLNSVTYENTSTTPVTGVRSITFVANDGVADSLTATAFVNVAGETAAPTEVTNIGSTVDEGATDSIETLELEFSDNLQPTSSIIYSIVSGPASGYLALTASPTIPITSFSQEQIDNGELIFVHDGSEVTSDSFTFTVDDSAGNSITGQVFNITVLPVNDAPETSTPGAQVTTEDTPLVFNAVNGNQISIADSDAGNNEVEVTITVSNGGVTLNGVGGLTFVTGGGTSDSTMTFRGTHREHVNASRWMV